LIQFGSFLLIGEPQGSAKTPSTEDLINISHWWSSKRAQ